MRNEKKLRFLLAYELRKQGDVLRYYDGRTDRASLQGDVLRYYDGRPPAKHSRASLQPLHVLLYYNGRTDRASLQGDVLLYYNGRSTVRPYNRYT